LAVSRRNFLYQGVIAATACAASPLWALGPKRPIGDNDQPQKTPPNSSSGSDNWQDHASALDNLDRARFSSAVGSNFKVIVAGAAQPVWVTLTGVKDLPTLALVSPASLAVANRQSAPAPATAGFVLLFGGSTQLPQGTYLFEHDALGRFALFTVPQGNGVQVYNAVVNRLTAPSIIAVPYGKGNAVVSTSGGTSSGSGAIVAPAASSGSEGPSADSSRIQVVRRALVKD